MPLTHPDMLGHIVKICRRKRLSLHRTETALLGALYKIHRPEKTAWQVAKILADVEEVDWPEALSAYEPRLKFMAALVNDLDAGYWCATLEYD